MRRKTCKDVIAQARKQIIDIQYKLEEENKRLKEDIINRYPEDMYGIKWISIYDTKKVDLEDKLLTAKLYRRAIESLDEFVEEELEHAKKKKSV